MVRALPVWALLLGVAILNGGTLLSPLLAGQLRGLFKSGI
jgi:hypothetical protein